MRLEELWERVEKPSRYTGGEYNSILKANRNELVRFAFAFPDIYEVGMSHLGTRILYDILNKREDTACERVFAPWVDMEAEMRKEEIPLYALESLESILLFDFVGFTLQYEISYTTLLNMLDLAGIPLRSSQRNNDHPLIIAGGPCAYNPEPLAPFIDCFVLGDGEEVIGRLIDVYQECGGKRADRKALLRAFSALPGVYVPTFYDVRMANGKIDAIIPREGQSAIIHKAIVKDLDHASFPEHPIVPYMDIIHDRLVLEVFRGCTRGCRFCQAGMVYRPRRERSVETLVHQAKEMFAHSGYDELSLSSLSTGDYSRFEELIRAMKTGPCGGNKSLSLPSLRLDAFGAEYMDALEGGRKTGLTLAPEAGTQRLRDVINKNVTEEDLMASVGHAFRSGWNRVKLYFMIGLPTETDEDLQGIADLARKVKSLYYQVPKEKGKGRLEIQISTSNFVPKPHTPFQWMGQTPVEELRRRQRLLKELLRIGGVSYSWHDAELSQMEAIFARGGRMLADVLEEARKLGCRLDGWHEICDLSRWQQAFANCGMDMNALSEYTYAQDEILPWDHIDSGVTKAYLQRELARAMSGITTQDCATENCQGCGLMKDCGRNAL